MLTKILLYAQDIAAEVLKDADSALHVLVSSVWAHIADDLPEKLQMLIEMLRRICTAKARGQPIRHCRFYVQLKISHAASAMHGAPSYICCTKSLVG